MTYDSDTSGNVVRGNQNYADEILTGAPVMSYRPLTECEQIYYHTIY